MKAVGNGVRSEVKEGYEDGGDVVLVLRDPRGRNDPVREDSCGRREGRDGRVQRPRSSRGDGGTTWWSCV
jgi:hypothetical protein